MAAPKEYGLIKRGSKSDAIQPRLSVFVDDSDEDGPVSVGKSLKREADKIKAKKQVKLDIQNALSEDPTVFEYDEVYDDMVQKKKDEIGLQKKKTEKKARYIDSLMKAAKSRTLDQERAYERKIQKERIAEGEQFAGKESFVTSAYKKKMQEMQEQEEKERRESQLEALTDVTKQKDLSGFYRGLYRQTLGPKEDVTEPTIDIKQEVDSSHGDSETEHKDDRSSFNSKPSSSKVERRPRQFRRRRESTSSSDDDRRSETRRIDTRKRSKSKDSRMSSDDESSMLVTESSAKMTKSRRRESVVSSSEDEPIRTEKRSRSDTNESKNRTSNHGSSSKSSERKNKVKDKGNTMEGEDKNDTKSTKEDDKPKISPRDRLIALFKKRTVGEVFDQAKERYFARREARNAMIAAFT